MALAQEPSQEQKSICLQKADTLQSIGVTSECKDAFHINQLIFSQSPYLLSHAFNPIHWQEWPDTGIPESDHRLIFVSIGYSTCHWCHVMAMESFMNQEVADLLNEFFVSVKVDREQRPQVDAKYRRALEAYKGEAGWPINLITTPDGKLLWIASYQTPVQLKKLLSRLGSLWQSSPQRLQAMAANFSRLLETAVNETGQLPTKSALESLLVHAEEKILSRFRQENENSEPVFPNEHWMAFLLMQNPQKNLSLVAERYWKIVNSATYDSIDGGLHRYSETADWNAPHFEKMLYNQAQWIALSAQLYRHTGDPAYIQIAELTHKWADSTLRVDHGYGSASSALSVEGEGKYYFFNESELRSLNEKANWVNYLTSEDNLLVTQIHDKEAMERLQAIRLTRNPPYRDEKVLVGWNAMYLSALLDLYEVTGSDFLLSKVNQHAQFIWENHWQSESKSLLRSVYQGNASIKGTFEDYAWTAYLFARLSRLFNNYTLLNKAYLLKNTISTSTDQRDYELPSAFMPWLLLNKELSLFGKSEQIALSWSTATDSELNYVGRLSGLREMYSPEFAGSRYFANGKGWVTAKLDAKTDSFLIRIELKDGWHINSHKQAKNVVATRLEVPGYEVDIDYPATEMLEASYADQPLETWSGDVMIKASFNSALKNADFSEKMAKNSNIAIRLDLQACSESLCYLPEKIALFPLPKTN